MTNYTMQCAKCGKIFKEKENVGGLSAGKAAVGGVLFGPVGAIVGAAAGKSKRNNTCPYCGHTVIWRC